MDNSESVSKDKQTLMRENSVLKEKEVNLRIIINKIKEWVDRNMTKTKDNTSANHPKIKEPACRLIYIQREESQARPYPKGNYWPNLSKNYSKGQHKR
jgi:hypothetical protein